jgi:hypothetical protein
VVTLIGVVPPPGRRTRTVWVLRMVREVAITCPGACRRRSASCAMSRPRCGPGAACRLPGWARRDPGRVLHVGRPWPNLLGLEAPPAAPAGEGC